MAEGDSSSARQDIKDLSKNLQKQNKDLAKKIEEGNKQTVKETNTQTREQLEPLVKRLPDAVRSTSMKLGASIRSALIATAGKGIANAIYTPKAVKEENKFRKDILQATKKEGFEKLVGINAIGFQRTVEALNAYYDWVVGKDLKDEENRREEMNLLRQIAETSRSSMRGPSLDQDDIGKKGGIAGFLKSFARVLFSLPIIISGIFAGFAASVNPAFTKFKESVKGFIKSLNNSISLFATPDAQGNVVQTAMQNLKEKLIAFRKMITKFVTGIFNAEQTKRWNKAYFKFRRLITRITGFFGRIASLFTVVEQADGSFKTPVLRKVVNATVSIFKKLGGFLSNFSQGSGFSKVVTRLFRIGETIGKTIGKLFLPVTIVIQTINGILGFFEGFNKQTGNIFARIARGLFVAVGNIIASMIGAPLDLLKGLAGWLLGLLGFERTKEALEQFTFVDIIKSFFDRLGAFFAWLAHFLGPLVAAIGGIISFVFAIVVQVIRPIVGVLDGIFAGIANIFSFVQALLDNNNEGIISSLISMLANFWSSVMSIILWPKRAFDNIVGMIDFLLSFFRKEEENTEGENEAKQNTMMASFKDLLSLPIDILRGVIDTVLGWFGLGGDGGSGEVDSQPTEDPGLVKKILSIPLIPINMAKNAVNAVLGWFGIGNGGDGEDSADDSEDPGLIKKILSIPLIPINMAKKAINAVLGWFGIGEGGDGEESSTPEDPGLIKKILSLPLLPFKIVKNAVDTVLGFFGVGDGEESSSESTSEDSGLIKKILSIPLLPLKIAKSAVDTVLGFFGVGDGGDEDSAGDSEDPGLVKKILSLPLLPFKVVKNAVDTVLGFFGLGGGDNESPDQPEPTDNGLLANILSIPFLPFNMAMKAVDTVLGWFGIDGGEGEGEGDKKKGFFQSLWDGLIGWVMSIFGVDPENMEGFSLQDIFQILIDGVKSFFGGIFDFIPSMESIKEAAFDFLPDWMKPKNVQEKADEAAERIGNKTDGSVTRADILAARGDEEAIEALIEKAKNDSGGWYGPKKARRDVERILAAEDMSYRQGSGGFRNFGRGSLAMLHGEEAIIPRSSGAGRLLESFDDFLTSSPSTGDDITAMASSREAMRSMASQQPVMIQSENRGDSPTNITNVSYSETNHIDETMRSVVFANAF